MKDIKVSLSWMLVIILLVLSISLGFAGTVYIDNGVLNLTEDMYVSKAIEGSFKGYIKGAYPIYDDTTTVNITTGNGECNGNYFKIETPIEHTIVNYDGGGFTYLYIDDSASAYPTPTIIDSTTEPVWSDAKQGWYNGDDRVIGALYDDSASTIAAFNNVGRKMFLTTLITIQDNGNPDGSYQATSTDADAKTPVNAPSIYVYGVSTDAASMVILRIKSVANPSHEIGQYGFYNTATVFGWINTGTEDRSITWKGEDDDDNIFKVQIIGWDLEI